MLCYQRSVAVEQLEHGVDVGQSELCGQRRDHDRSAGPKLQPVLVLLIVAAEDTVAGDALGRGRNRPGAIGLGHVRDLEADGIRAAARRLCPDAPQASRGVAGYGQPARDAISVPLFDVHRQAPRSRIRDPQGNRIRKGQPVVLGTSHRCQPDPLYVLKPPPAQREFDLPARPRSRRECRVGHGKVADAEHVPAVLVAIDALWAAVLVELEVIRARALEGVLDERCFQVLVAVVVEGDPVAVAVEQRHVVFEKSPVFDRSQVERPALPGPGLEPVGVDVFQLVHPALDRLRPEADRLSARDGVVRFHLERGGESIDVEHARVRQSPRGAQRCDMRP